MKSLYLTLVLVSGLNSTLSFGEAVYIGNDVDSNSTKSEFLFTSNDKEEINLSGLLESSTLGMNLKGVSKSFRFDKAYIEAMAKMGGLPSVPAEQASYYQFPAYNIEVSSKVIENRIDVATSLLGSIQKKSYLFSPLSLNVEFYKEQEVLSNRQSYSDVNAEHQKLYNGVFQIYTNLGASSTGGESKTHGTGFFISGKGHALTNHHVLKENKGCIKDKVCTLDIRLKGEETKQYDVKVKVLTCSIENDFCLLSIDTKDLEFRYFDLDLNNIPLKLFTLGFPGDRTSTDEDGNEEVPLTYSYGSSIGLSGKAITSTVFIKGGASGSPVLREEDNKVVGILSNGAETFAQSYDGAPGIYRPLILIERDFKLSSYLDNSKSILVGSIVNNIKNANNLEEAQIALDKYENEKTYIGYSDLVQTSYMHANVKVRKILVNYLLLRSDNNW